MQECWTSPKSRSTLTSHQRLQNNRDSKPEISLGKKKKKNLHPNSQNFYSLTLLKMKDLLKFSTEKNHQPKTKTKLSQVKVILVTALFRACLSCSEIINVFHDFFSPSEAGPAVLGVSQDEPGSLMASCFPPALSKRGKLVLQDRCDTLKGLNYGS